MTVVGEVQNQIWDHVCYQIQCIGSLHEPVHSVSWIQLGWSAYVELRELRNDS